MNSKIKILHVLGGLNLGGAETVVMNFYNYIDKDIFSFDFVVHENKKGVYEEEITKLGGNIYHMPKYKLYNHFSYKKAWDNFFKSHCDYQIVHGHVRSTAAIYLKIAKKYNIKTIAHSHSISNGNNFKAIIKRLLQLNIKNVADFFMGCSYEANVWLFGNKIANSDKCYILNNAINYDKFRFNEKSRKEIRNKYGIKDDEFLLGHVGRLSKEKNHIFMIDVLSNLVKKNNKVKLMFCGTGNLESIIKNYAIKKNVINNIFFVPSTKEIFKYYSSFDLFLFPSKFEGFGMAAIEAQVSGLSVLLSNKVPNCVNISDNCTFLNIDKESIDEWVKNINFYLDNKKDRTVNVKNNYDINYETKRLEKIYSMIGGLYEKKI